MKREEFKRLAFNNILILDGSTGMNMVKAGMPAGVCPEKWIIDNPHALIELQTEYIKAGSNIVYAPTFTANRIKLEEYGYEADIEHINRELVKISRKATNGKALVAGNLSMTGKQLYPMGDMKFEELVNIYKEQVSYILMEGVDLFAIETMMSLAECRAALLAVKELCDLPVMVTLSFNDDNRTLYGTDPKTAIIVLQSMGADAVGVNCSTGPKKMVNIIEEMARYAKLPIVAKPNAGLPQLVDAKTVYLTTPQEFAEEMRLLINAGASIVGGCCGTTPEHINKLANMAQGMKDKNWFFNNMSNISTGIRALTTERRTLDIDIDGRFMIIGERINPTGKKALQAQLREGIFDIVSDMAEEQVEQGADILDINVGMNGIDEKQMMLEVMDEVMRVTDVPLCIDSSYIEVIEAALRVYPGRALINSISLEKEKFEKLIPMAKKYGAMFILLPLSDNGLPKDLDEKKHIIETIINRAYECELTKEDIIVDGLVTTVGANKNAAIEVLETITYCKNELGLATSCGLSNISFGLPERRIVNSTFLAFAIKEGLTMAIANPSQNLLMNTAYASDLLKACEESDVRYINRVSEYPQLDNNTIITDKATADNGGIKGKITGKNPIFIDVVKGNKKSIVSNVMSELEKSDNAKQILDEYLIGAINFVGELFEQKVYFLPQLIASAETMKLAIDYIEPKLAAESDGSTKETVIIATVEGDIHDIGKNLVALMIKNYGYNVIDLGKDVSAETIIEEAKKSNASIIALSALMTTTMMQMNRVVELAKKEGLNVKIIIGGAVVTQDFADEIGADGYSKDAQEAVGLVKSLLTP